MPAVTIQIIGMDAAQAKLARRKAPRLTASSRRGLKAAGEALKPFIQSAAPERTGKTRSSVKVIRGQTTYRVGPTIWYKHFVIGGTKRGIEANPWVSRGANAGRSAASLAFNATVKRDVTRR